MVPVSSADWNDRRDFDHGAEKTAALAATVLAAIMIAAIATHLSSLAHPRFPQSYLVATAAVPVSRCYE